MKSKKSCLLILSLLCSSFVYANQMRMSYPGKQTTIQTRKMDIVDDYGVDEDFIDFDLDEDVEDVAGLVPLWARFANKIAAPFFVFYNKMSHWWQGRLKKNDYVKRF